MNIEGITSQGSTNTILNNPWIMTDKVVSKSDRDLCKMFHDTVARSQNYVQFRSMQSLSHVQLFATPWNAACQDSLSITHSWIVLKLMSIKSVIPSNHFILCCPLILLSSIFPSIRVFSKESVPHIRWSKYQTSLHQVVKIMHRLGFKSLLMMCSVFSFFCIYSLLSISELYLLNWQRCT